MVLAGGALGARTRLTRIGGPVCCENAVATVTGLHTEFLTVLQVPLQRGVERLQRGVSTNRPRYSVESRG